MHAGHSESMLGMSLASQGTPQSSRSSTTQPSGYMSIPTPVSAMPARKHATYSQSSCEPAPGQNGGVGAPDHKCTDPPLLHQHTRGEQPRKRVYAYYAAMSQSLQPCGGPTPCGAHASTAVTMPTASVRPQTRHRDRFKVSV